MKLVNKLYAGSSVTNSERAALYLLLVGDSLIDVGILTCFVGVIIVTLGVITTPLLSLAGLYISYWLGKSILHNVKAVYAVSKLAKS